MKTEIEVPDGYEINKVTEYEQDEVHEKILYVHLKPKKKELWEVFMDYSDCGYEYENKTAFCKKAERDIKDWFIERCEAEFTYDIIERIQITIGVEE